MKGMPTSFTMKTRTRVLPGRQQGFTAMPCGRSNLLADPGTFGPAAGATGHEQHHRLPKAMVDEEQHTVKRGHTQHDPEERCLDQPRRHDGRQGEQVEEVTTEEKAHTYIAKNTVAMRSTITNMNASTWKITGVLKGATRHGVGKSTMKDSSAASTNMASVITSRMTSMTARPPTVPRPTE